MALLEHIIRQNPQWKDGTIQSVSGYRERLLIGDIEKYIKDRQIIALMGLRRTGKTTLLYHLINRLIKDGTDPKDILYFSFDELIGSDPEIIEKAIAEYELKIIKRDVGNCLVFFDEINHVNDWQVVIKRFYDLGRNIKFFVSGSAGVSLKKSKESLAGRIYEFELKPLGFAEYLSLKGRDPGFVDPVYLKRELNAYLVGGGFPELLEETDFERIKRYTSSIVEKIIFYDIPAVYEVGDPHSLNEVFKVVAKNPGALTEYGNIASALKLTYQTVSKYMKHLERAYLTHTVYNKRGSPIASGRKAKKTYLASTALASAYAEDEAELERIWTKLVENAVANHLNAKHFYRNRQEIDFVTNLAVEVKYSNDPDATSSIRAARKLKLTNVDVVTKDEERETYDEGMRIRYIPLWKYLNR